MPPELNYGLCPKLSPSAAWPHSWHFYLCLSLAISTDHYSTSLWLPSQGHNSATCLNSQRAPLTIPIFPEVPHTALQSGDPAPEDLSSAVGCHYSFLPLCWGLWIQDASPGPSWACYWGEPKTMDKTALQILWERRSQTAGAGSAYS